VKLKKKQNYRGLTQYNQSTKKKDKNKKTSTLKKRKKKPTNPSKSSKLDLISKTK
jgi:hypothetical protein